MKSVTQKTKYLISAYTSIRTLKFAGATCIKHCILAAIMCLGLQALAQANEKQDQAKLERVQKNIEKLKRELYKAQSNRDNIKQTIEKSEKEIIDLKTKAEKIQSEIKSSEKSIQKLESQKSAFIDKKKIQQNQVSQHVQAAFRLGKKNNISTLLNQQNPAEVSRNMRYLNYIVAARHEKIITLETTLDEIKRLESRTISETNKLRASHRSLKNEQTALAKQKKSREATIAALEKTLTNRGDKLASLELDRKHLAKLLSQVAGILNDEDLNNDTQKFSILRGKLPWPTKGNLIHQFNSPRVGNNVKWQGLVIKANAGTPVRSVHHGRVVFSDYLRGHGLLIIIDHGAGYLSLYAHNESLIKSLGDWVASGEVIAHVGDTGGQKVAGLYFELRYKGKPQNPTRWLKSA